jgi:hypothetical protein
MKPILQLVLLVDEDIRRDRDYTITHNCDKKGGSTMKNINKKENDEITIFILKSPRSLSILSHNKQTEPVASMTPLLKLNII